MRAWRSSTAGSASAAFAAIGGFGRCWRRCCGRLDLVAAQTTEYAERFLALGAPPAAVQVTGSIKFDGAEADRQNPETVRLAQLAGFAPDDVVFLAGSTQEPEEELALGDVSPTAPSDSRGCG